MKSKRSALIWSWISLVVIAVDQLCKYAAVKYLIFNQPYPIFSFFNLTLIYNRGASFGFLDQSSGWQVGAFALISLIVSGLILVWLKKLHRSDVLLGISLSLILGGAIGNLIDRIRLHYVIDFFDFHIGTWHFAIFNTADTAITIGAFFLILKLLWGKGAEA